MEVRRGADRNEALVKRSEGPGQYKEGLVWPGPVNRSKGFGSAGLVGIFGWSLQICREPARLSPAESH